MDELVLMLEMSAQECEQLARLGERRLDFSRIAGIHRADFLERRIDEGADALVDRRVEIEARHARGYVGGRAVCKSRDAGCEVMRSSNAVSTFISLKLIVGANGIAFPKHGTNSRKSPTTAFIRDRSAFLEFLLNKTGIRFKTRFGHLW